MPKKIPMSEKREWLVEYDDGKPAAAIAREKKRALKVIKRGIEEARAERDGAAARAEIVKEALVKHQKQLMGIIERLQDAAEPPPADTEIRREKSGAIAPIPISAGLILYTHTQGITVELSDEDATLWGLLKQHLTRDRIWSAIKNWKEALTNRTKAILEFESGIRRLLESETGLRVTEGKPADDNVAFIYPHAAKLFFTVNIRKTLGISDETDLQERMVATDDGYIRHGKAGPELAYCPGKQDECRDALLGVLKKIPDMPETKKVVVAEGELKIASGKLKRMLEDITLMGLVPGRCRICSRISL